jgi:alkylation response protein AidB-like acyl-CoA dehydrogenase
MNNCVSPWMDDDLSIFRDAAARFLYGGTNEIMKELISRAL